MQWVKGYSGWWDGCGQDEVFKSVFKSFSRHFVSDHETSCDTPILLRKKSQEKRWRGRLPWLAGRTWNEQVRETDRGAVLSTKLSNETVWRKRKNALPSSQGWEHPQAIVPLQTASRLERRWKITLETNRRNPYFKPYRRGRIASETLSRRIEESCFFPAKSGALSCSEIRIRPLKGWTLDRNSREVIGKWNRLVFIRLSPSKPHSRLMLWRSIKGSLPSREGWYKSYAVRWSHRRNFQCLGVSKS